VRAAQLNTSRFSSGELTNLLSTDADRVANFCPSFHAVWALPVQMIVALVYKQSVQRNFIKQHKIFLFS
jgi:hypothetical protein